MEDDVKKLKLEELKVFIKIFEDLRDIAYKTGSEMSKTGMILSPVVDAVAALHNSVKIMEYLKKQLENGQLEKMLDSDGTGVLAIPEDGSEPIKLSDSGEPKVDDSDAYLERLINDSMKGLTKDKKEYLN